MSNRYRSILSLGSSTPFSNVNSFLFDGIDEKMFSTANYTEINGTQKFSVSFWLKPIDSNDGVVFRFGKQGSTSRLACIYYPSVEIIIISFGTNSYYYRSVNGSIPLNQWSHIVYTYDGTQSRYNRPEIYVNGVLSQGTNSGVTSSQSNFDGTLELGGTGTSGQINFGNNYIDEFAVWNNTTLTQTQANELWNGGTPSDLNNIASGLAQPTTWFRMGELASWDGTKWTMTDVNGGTTLTSAFMVEASRTTDVPPNPFANTKSILLGGIDDYVDIGNPTNLNTITNISISAWFKTTSTAGNRVIVGSDDQIQGRRYILRTESSNGIKLRFFSFSSNGSFDDIIGTTNINDGQWHHVMAINNGTNLKIYIDGVLDNSNTNGNLINTTFATPNINIGRRSYSGIEGYFDGKIDEVAIWGNDQSANASAIGGTIPTDLSTYNPLGWWRCGDGDTSPTLIDNGSGGNNGTMVFFNTFSTDVPT